jgi:adenylate kinase
VQRPDDREDTVRKRIETYHAQTRPLVDYYLAWSRSGEPAAPSYVNVQGVGSIEEIRDQIFAAIDAQRPPAA